ncbi:fertility inhibition protein FinO [Escherichia coli]
MTEKAAREAEQAAKKAQARQALSIYLNLPTLDEAVNTLKPWWPGLFDGDTPRLLAGELVTCYWKTWCSGISLLSHKKLRRALKAITRSESYLCAMKAGACRYDTEGLLSIFLRRRKRMRQRVWIKSAAIEKRIRQNFRPCLMRNKKKPPSERGKKQGNKA